MRHVCVLIGLTLLVAPVCASAQPAPDPPSLDEPCPVPADPRWTPQEAFVWERICVGKEADFNEAPGYGGELDPKSQSDWPQNRILRSAFLEMILLKDPYRRVLTHHGVGIRGARFSEALDLAGAELPCVLALVDSLFERGAKLAELKSKHFLILHNSNVQGMLHLGGAQVRLLVMSSMFSDVDLG